MRLNCKNLPLRNKKEISYYWIGFIFDLYITQLFKFIYKNTDIKIVIVESLSNLSTAFTFDNVAYKKQRNDIFKE